MQSYTHLNFLFEKFVIVNFKMRYQMEIFILVLVIAIYGIMAASPFLHKEASKIDQMSGHSLGSVNDSQGNHITTSGEN